MIHRRSTGVITPNDPRDVFYLVGFLEYGEALNRFDQLMATLSPDEVEAVEQIVQADIRLAFESNLSRRLESGPTPLSEPDAPAAKFRQHSLAWVMALARVEVGAMLAAFSETPKPFQYVRPSAYEAVAYRELLLDGLRTHYLTLPPAAQWHQMEFADNQVVLAMQRRLTLAVRFAEAVRDAGVDPAKIPAVSRVSTQLTSLKTLVENHIRGRLKTIRSSELGDERLRGSKTYDVEGFNVKLPEPTSRE